jgi:hypothetical protein
MRSLGSTPAPRWACQTLVFSAILATAQLCAKRRAPAAPAKNLRWERAGSRRTTTAVFLSVAAAGPMHQIVPNRCIGAISTEIDSEQVFALTPPLG